LLAHLPRALGDDEGGTLQRVQMVYEVWPRRWGERRLLLGVGSRAALPVVLILGLSLALGLEVALQCGNLVPERADSLPLRVGVVL
jgi:hypothetical protein